MKKGLAVLLRSISKHVKDQNWFAVALDFFIVVIGILIAFQITNWNEGRAERAEEREIVLQLIAEAHETNVRIESNAAFDAERLSAAMRAHKALKAQSLTEAQIAQLHDDLRVLGPWGGVDYVTASLNRLVDADRLSLITDPELQLSISWHKENVDERLMAHQNVGQMNLDHSVAVNDRFDFEMKDGKRVIMTPIEDLLADNVLERRVGQFAFTYQVFDGFHESSRERNANYLTDLTRYAEDKGWLE